MLNIIPIALLLWVIVSCRSLSEPQDSQTQMLVADNVALWSDPSHIPVCWEPLDGSGSNYIEEKGWVKEAIGNTWSQANPKIQFIGWGSCPPKSSGLRIKIDNSIGGHTSGFGAALAGMQSGLQLTLDISAFLKQLQMTDNFRDICLTSREATKACVQSIAIHEFGHVLGLTHEQNRSDVTGDCDKFAPYQSIAGVAIGAYDPDSIMNYCANLKNAQQTRLSVGDKQGIVALYSGVKVGTQDPGRPALNFAQESMGDVKSIVWGHDVTIQVSYYSNPKSPAANLPNPAVSLKIAGSSMNAAIPCGPWMITPVSASLEIRSCQCPFHPTVTGPQNLGDLRWNDKFVASLGVDLATSAFVGIESGTESGFFDVSYTVLVAPGIAAPQVTLNVATLTDAQAVATAPVNCAGYGSAGNYICTASSKVKQPLGTILKINGEIMVAGKKIKLVTGYGSVP